MYKTGYCTKTYPSNDLENNWHTTTMIPLMKKLAIVTTEEIINDTLQQNTCVNVTKVLEQVKVLHGPQLGMKCFTGLCVPITVQNAYLKHQSAFNEKLYEDIYVKI